MSSDEDSKKGTISMFKVEEEKTSVSLALSYQ
jgi:hypothetical protein